jgi:hypothetical protein
MKMKVFFTILTILLSSVIWAQTNKQIKNNYLVVYPIEALVGHLRIGYEKEFSSNNSFLIEGQYYFTDDRFRDYLISRNNYWGLALKSEVRFYENNEENKNRKFLGANLMVKRNENMRLDVGETFNNFVFSLNIKTGTEFFINNNCKMDLYFGLGIRVKTVGIKPTIGGTEPPELIKELVYPNLLLGLDLKFR